MLNFNSLRAVLLTITVMLFSAGAHARTLTDITGRQVTIPDHPQRIVLGESRMLYSVALLTPGNPLQHIVGWPQDLKKYDPQTWQIFARQFAQMETIPVVGLDGVNDMNSEQVIALKPDVVILPQLARDSENSAVLEKMLAAAHIPVVKIDLRVNLLKNTERSITLLGEVLNQPQRAAEFNHFYRSHMQRIADRLADYHGPKPSVLLQLHLGRRSECCVTSVNGNLGELLTFAGGNNIASQQIKGVFGRLSEESVIVAQPEYYFATGTGSADEVSALKLGPAVTTLQTRQSLLALTGQQNALKQLTALREGHTGAIWHNFYLSPWHVVATEFFATTLYPQLFRDVDPEQTLQQLFRNFLPIPYSGSYLYRLAPEKTAGSGS
ncbi:ABC transporter substrate-binding protein [Pantoea sp. Bo_2]|uniref:ABC transporter substrate-binding protein n=2 Tax=Erwiniaceae TaxID=1903409 RepID=A0AB34CK11_9GAMM|nr:ABC transporter substrate-binding protein [Pantoea sp. VH_8]KAA5936823.1 ABC transporter substrate-binding protein [Pantoea sp. VH_4]KAA5948379.1 ABC transporter substrate-binding protein [Pantoea sp. VH_3]KAA5953649.1 ABC transporter substrate-binding protein [Pantoea sp. VH_25]KAA5956516.1 ABC transporter substrate-binding protein [Pantoea sp. VH_24]KAA5960362.1 ABC transporter substrate-binding protein [Pantoea sp. VH_16]KAA5964933.1 ABC transporter substrate-binding protein [Pantoea sp